MSEKSDDEEQLSSDAQAGVRAVEAAATVWTKWHLIGAYVMYVCPSIITPSCTDECIVSGGFISW